MQSDNWLGIGRELAERKRRLVSHCQQPQIVDLDCLAVEMRGPVSRQITRNQSTQTQVPDGTKMTLDSTYRKLNPQPVFRSMTTLGKLAQNGLQTW